MTLFAVELCTMTIRNIGSGLCNRRGLYTLHSKLQAFEQFVTLYIIEEEENVFDQTQLSTKYIIHQTVQRP